MNKHCQCFCTLALQGLQMVARTGGTNCEILPVVHNGLCKNLTNFLFSDVSAKFGISCSACIKNDTVRIIFLKFQGEPSIVVIIFVNN